MASLRSEMEHLRLTVSSQGANLRSLESDLERALEDKAEATRLR